MVWCMYPGCRGPREELGLPWQGGVGFAGERGGGVDRSGCQEAAREVRVGAMP